MISQRKLIIIWWFGGVERILFVARSDNKMLQNNDYSIMGLQWFYYSCRQCQVTWLNKQYNLNGKWLIYSHQLLQNVKSNFQGFYILLEIVNKEYRLIINWQIMLKFNIEMLKLLIFLMFVSRIIGWDLLLHSFPILLTHQVQVLLQGKSRKFFRNNGDNDF